MVTIPFENMVTSLRVALFLCRRSALLPRPRGPRPQLCPPLGPTSPWQLQRLYLALRRHLKPYLRRINRVFAAEVVVACASDVTPAVHRLAANSSAGREVLWLAPNEPHRCFLTIYAVSRDISRRHDTVLSEIFRHDLRVIGAATRPGAVEPRRLSAIAHIPAPSATPYPGSFPNSQTVLDMTFKWVVLPGFVIRYRLSSDIVNAYLSVGWNTRGTAHEFDTIVALMTAGACCGRWYVSLHWRMI